MGLAGASSEEEDSSSSSDDSSLDSLELDSGLGTVFARDVLAFDAFAVVFAVAGLVTTSSEAEDSSSDDSPLDSSLELDAAAPVPFEGGGFTGVAFVGAGLDLVSFVAAVPLAAALAADFDSFPSESSSLSDSEASDSLSPDSEEESALGGAGLDYVEE
jgi:hypothetical protein